MYSIARSRAATHSRTVSITNGRSETSACTAVAVFVATTSTFTRSGEARSRKRNTSSTVRASASGPRSWGRSAGALASRTSVNGPSTFASSDPASRSTSRRTGAREGDSRRSGASAASLLWLMGGTSRHEVVQGWRLESATSGCTAEKESSRRRLWPHSRRRCKFEADALAPSRRRPSRHPLRGTLGRGAAAAARSPSASRPCCWPAISSTETASPSAPSASCWTSWAAWPRREFRSCTPRATTTRSATPTAHAPSRGRRTSRSWGMQPRG